MLSKLSYEARTHLLLLLTALVVAVARMHLQYPSLRHSAGGFLECWFVHYMALWIFLGISYAIVSNYAKFFLQPKPENHTHDVELHEVIFTVSVFLLVVAVLILMFGNRVPDDIS